MNNFKSYKQSGVDVQKGNDFVRRIAPLVEKTYQKGVLGNLGAFAGFFEIDFSQYHHPVLVSATDGVGTKLKVAQKAKNYKSIGIDLVAMCVNDIIVHGAKPLFFLDYIGIGKMDTSMSYDLVEGITQGCLLSGASLIGGETAEMPSLYAHGDFDLAGFCVGIVDKEKIITGQDIVEGDVLIGIPSSGLHSNGYSLVRQIIFEEKALDCQDFLFDNISVEMELLRPTKIYVKMIHRLLKQSFVKGIVHITGGGFHENIPRILPQHLTFELKKKSWPSLPIFEYIQRERQLSQLEMEHIFNCGIGMILIVSPDDIQNIQSEIHKCQESSYLIGEVIPFLSR